MVLSHDPHPFDARPTAPMDMSQDPHRLGAARTPAMDMSHDPDRFDAARTPAMDMSQDPDRFDPDRVEPAPELPRGLDPAYDPDRYRPPGQGQTLTDLLGKEGTHEGDRDGYQWVLGLVGVFLFLGIVAFLFNSVLTP